jgi:hypothetical protein
MIRIRVSNLYFSIWEFNVTQVSQSVNIMIGMVSNVAVVVSVQT